MTVELTAIHLCCGAGGGSLGLEQAGIKTTWAFDLDANSVASHQANFPHAPADVRDIRNLHIDDIPQADVWVCGVPCGPFSVAGRKLEEKDERDISSDLARLLKASSGRPNAPRYVFLENVPPYGKSKSAALVCSALREAGFISIFEEVFIHADFGVCQKRRRWHLIASKVAPAPFPLPTNGKEGNGALIGLPRWVEFRAIRERFVEKPRFLSQRALEGVLRRQKSKGLSAGLRGDKSAYNVLYIVGDDDLMPTVLAAWGKGLSRNQAVVIFDDYRFRMPTMKETTRCQGFPDGFLFLGTLEEQYQQVGQAIPPPFAEAVGLALVAHANETW
jgi:DNA (cytosine-5)-methyltransferase 1